MTDDQMQMVHHSLFDTYEGRQCIERLYNSYRKRLKEATVQQNYSEIARLKRMCRIILKDCAENGWKMQLHHTKAENYWTIEIDEDEDDPEIMSSPKWMF